MTAHRERRRFEILSRFKDSAALLAAALLGIGAAQAQARAQDVTIGYQLIYNPWKAAIVNGDFEKATGYKIDWRKYDSGAKVNAAMAAGDVHLAVAGSSPIAAGVRSA